MIIEQGTPVVSSAAPRPRWTVAVIAAVAALAIAIGGVAGAFLVGGRIAGSGAGPAASYVPADAVTYMEVNLDLPGDQRAMLHQILDRFAPIDSDTLLGPGLAGWLDEALTPSTNPHLNYSTDIAPWFDGQLAMSVNDYPSVSDPMAMTFPSMVAVVGVRDRAACAAFIERMRTEAQQQGASFSKESHQGVDVWSLDVNTSSAGPMAGMMPGFAYAITEDGLLVGTGSKAVDEALDAHAGATRNLAQRDDLRQLAGRLPSDRVGFMSVDTSAIVAQMRATAEKTDPAMAQMFDELMAGVPSLAVAAARFENDRLSFESVSQAPTGANAVHNTQRDLARWTPSDTIFFSDAPALGGNLARIVKSFTAGMSAAGVSPRQLDQVESALGGDLESFVSWIGDAAMVAGWDGEQPYGGLILVPNDAAVARQRIGQLAAFARLAADQPGSAFTVSDETVDGVTVTTFRYAAAGSFEGFGVPGFALQYAVTDERVLIGFGDRFVGRALDLSESESLAASARYQAAMASVGGATNAGSSYLDLAALRGAVEQALPADGRAAYEPTVLPYVAPFDYLAAASRVDGSVVDSKVAIVVR